MSDLVTYVKPDGLEIQINTRPETLEAAKRLNWKPKDAPKKRGPKPKEKTEAKEE